MFEECTKVEALVEILGWRLGLAILAAGFFTDELPGHDVSVSYTPDDLGRVNGVSHTLSGSTSLSLASFAYEGGREVSRTYGQHDLKRTQSWTSFRESPINSST